MGHCIGLFFFTYVKDRFRRYAQFFFWAVLQVKHLILLTIILKVEGGVNKNLGERE
jgi:hypothetical protein